MPNLSLLSWQAATAGTPHSTNYPIPAMRADDLSPCLLFDRAYVKIQYYEGVMPHFYLAGNLVVSIMWSAASAVSGTCVWEFGMERHYHGGASLDGWGGSALASVVSTPGPTIGTPVYTQVTVANAQAVQAGEHFTFYIARRPENDTMVGEAELWSIEIVEA